MVLGTSRGGAQAPPLDPCMGQKGPCPAAFSLPGPTLHLDDRARRRNTGSSVGGRARHGARKPGAVPLSWRQPCLMATFVASGVVAFGIGTRTSKMPLV